MRTDKEGRTELGHAGTENRGLSRYGRARRVQAGEVGLCEKTTGLAGKGTDWQERNETERKGGTDKAFQCRHNVLNFFFLKCTTTFTKKQLSSKEA